MTLTFSLTSRKFIWRKFWGTMGVGNQGLKLMPRIHVPMNRVRTTPKMTLTLQGCWHSPPRLEVRCPLWIPPPLLLKPPIHGVIVPGRNTRYTSIPRPEKQLFQHSPKAQEEIHRLFLREFHVRQNHIEQVGPGGDQTLMVMNINVLSPEDGKETVVVHYYIHVNQSRLR